DDLFVNPDTSIIMHHKYLITDHGQPNADPQLWVGSHNWSTNANTRNDENTLVIHDANLVNQYYQEFSSRTSTPPVTGCTDASACNYNPLATVGDFTCLFIAAPCDDLNPNTINDAVNFGCECIGQTIVNGCTNVSACNFSSSANTDDGSCLFVGDLCDDSNSLTLNDSISSNCECVGILNGVLEVESDMALIYPNPNHGEFQLSGVNLSAIHQIYIFDAVGKSTALKPSQFAVSNNALNFNLSNMSAGRYVILLETDRGILHQTVILE
ncbi:MAG: phospholipase D-like domain-containing protein, partial [Flavobacteriales bacterium]